MVITNKGGGNLEKRVRIESCFSHTHECLKRTTVYKMLL